MLSPSQKENNVVLNFRKKDSKSKTKRTVKTSAKETTVATLKGELTRLKEECGEVVQSQENKQTVKEAFEVIMELLG